MKLTRGRPEESDPAHSGSAPEYDRTFLALTQRAALPSNLRRVLASSPATRRWQMLAGREGNADVHMWINLTINNFGPFNYRTSYDALPFGGRH